MPRNLWGSTITEKKYALSWDVQCENKITKTRLKNSGRGGADALLVCSVLRDSSGATSTAFFGLDGQTKQALSATEYFKIWSALSDHLRTEQSLPGQWQMVLGIAFLLVRAIIVKTRNQELVNNTCDEIIRLAQHIKESH